MCPLLFVSLIHVIGESEFLYNCYSFKIMKKNVSDIGWLKADFIWLAKIQCHFKIRWISVIPWTKLVNWFRFFLQNWFAIIEQFHCKSEMNLIANIKLWTKMDEKSVDSWTMKLFVSKRMFHFSSWSFY